MKQAVAMNLRNNHFATITANAFTIDWLETEMIIFHQLLPELGSVQGNSFNATESYTLCLSSRSIWVSVWIRPRVSG